MGSLYRKYRSRSLSEIVGQDHVTSLLGRALEAGQHSHAYLLTGPKGVGKTSIARILAHEINKLPYSDDSDHLDIIEIDAASNNGVDHIRDLLERVHIAPTSAAKKIYIIDEVHMLSKPAFNALLKTLEEPPEHIVFILATTDPDKLPATIISRVQRFGLRAISEQDLMRHLAEIAKNEDIVIDNDALELIAQHGDGSFRDSISLLDQLRFSSDTKISASDIEKALGVPQQKTLETLVRLHGNGDINAIVSTLKHLEESGVQPTVIATQLLRYLKNNADKSATTIALMDALLGVATSSQPAIKLLTVLGSKTKSSLQHSSNEKESFVKEVADTPAHPQPYPSPAPTAKNKTTFSWQSLLDILKNDASLLALLKKSQPAVDNQALTIYAGTKFNADRLSSAKQMAKIHEALGTIGAADMVVDIKPEKAPLEDSETAAIADIMGGGEEVDYDG